VVDIVFAEADGDATPTAAGWVAANLAAVGEALEEAHTGPRTVGSLRRWHRTLMTGSPTPSRLVGVVRDEQGWIGGTSPLDAHVVTPRPEHVPDLLDDLVAYVNRTDVDPVSQAAIAHAQFELIHPFADGNGRVGRVLIAWVLVRASHSSRRHQSAPGSLPTSAATARGSCCSAWASTTGGCSGLPTPSPVPDVRSRS
jgi:Fic family protein